MTTNSMLPALNIMTGAPVQPAAEAPLACDLTAIASTDRPQHTDVAAYLFGDGLRERQELPDGYAFRYGADDFEVVSGFIAQERRCCPFFSFVIELAAHDGPLWLRISGPDGAKEFIQSTFNQ